MTAPSPGFLIWRAQVLTGLASKRQTAGFREEVSRTEPRESQPGKDWDIWSYKVLEKKDKKVGG